MVVLEHWNPATQSQGYHREFQTVDVELAVCTGPGSRNRGIQYGRPTTG